MSTEEIELNDRNFEAETKNGLTLAFFWDPLESGCRREWAIIEKAADVIGDRMRIGRCNVEESPELTGKLNVRSIPTTLVIRDGKEEERLVGLRHERTLIRHIKKYLEQEA